jgi:RHS repeat-associated protein
MVVLSGGGYFERGSSITDTSRVELNYNYFRDYDPQVGRYAENDPIGLNGGSYSTYNYAFSSPILAGDPSGLAVTVIGHVAAGPLGHLTNPTSYHAALYLNPDDPCHCAGTWPMTLGAQPIAGRLSSFPDYSGDCIANAKFRQVVPTPPGMSDCYFFHALLDAEIHYTGVPYSFPSNRSGDMAKGKYNSNSFVSGLIRAAGGNPPTIPIPGGQLPGYLNPVPIGR